MLLWSWQIHSAKSQISVGSVKLPSLANYHLCRFPQDDHTFVVEDGDDGGRYKDYEGLETKRVGIQGTGNQSDFFFSFSFFFFK